MPSKSRSTPGIAFRASILTLGWIGLTAALFGIGELVVHSHAITDFDRTVTRWVVSRRTPPLNAAMRVITWIGSWVAVALTSAVALVLVVAKRVTIGHFLLLIAAWAGEYATVNIVKYAVGRPRPPADLWLVTAHGASFPSGHAANATLVCVVGSLIAFLFASRRAFRTTTITLACLVVAAVGFSRVELGVHWITDVMAGCLVTAVWLGAIAWAFSSVLFPPAPDQDQHGVIEGRGSPADPTTGMR